MPDDLGPAAVLGWLSQPGPEANSERNLAGAVFLLSPELAVTCTHVICDHLGLKTPPEVAPETPIALRFEALGVDIKATVLPEGWYPDTRAGTAGDLRDVAFLCLSTPVEAEGLRYLPFAPWVPRGGRPALVFGAESGYQDMGQNVRVKLAENMNVRGLWQLDLTSSTSFKVVRGFSGAPLLDEAGTVIWGMVVRVDAKERPIAFAVGADRLYEARRRLTREVSVVVSDASRRLPDPVVPEEMRLLQEQALRANMERDSALKELEVLRKRLWDTA
jgi:hypothetical protein